MGENVLQQLWIGAAAFDMKHGIAKSLAGYKFTSHIIGTCMANNGILGRIGRSRHFSKNKNKITEK